MKSLIVMISGQQGAGKSTITKMLLDRFNNKHEWTALEIRFAQVIYNIHDVVLSIMQEYGIETPHKDGELLQLLGTEWGRKKYGDNVWVNATQKIVSQTQAMPIYKEDDEDLPANKLIVISDCRFRNEFDAFSEALRVRLVCPEEVRKLRADSWRENTQHLSEIDLDAYSANGMFDLYLRTDRVNQRDCVELIMAQLDKNSWLEKRNLCDI